MTGQDQAMDEIKVQDISMYGWMIEAFYPEVKGCMVVDEEMDLEVSEL